MDRRDIARGIAATVSLYQALLADAEVHCESNREVTDGCINAIARLKAELADYEKTVATLREQLREEQTRRASYQAVDAAARRFIAVVERLEETTSRPIDTPVNYEIAKLATAVRYA